MTAPHIKQFYFWGASPNYASQYSACSSYNLERIPLERLSNFLQSLKTHGPTYREIIEYIKMLNSYHKADPQLQSAETLSHSDMISILENVKTAKDKQYSMNKFEKTVLMGFLHMLKFAKVVRRMKQNSHLIQSLFVRNQMMADQGKLANLLKVYGLEEHEAPDSDEA